MYKHTRWRWKQAHPVSKIYRVLFDINADKEVLIDNRNIMLDDNDNENGLGKENGFLIEFSPLFMEAFDICYDLYEANRNPTSTEIAVMNSARCSMEQIKDLSEERESEKITAYKISLPDYGSNWMHAGVTPSDVADTIKNEIEGNEGMLFGEQSDIKIQAYETTQDEIDSLGDFQGW